MFSLWYLQCHNSFVIILFQLLKIFRNNCNKRKGCTQQLVFIYLLSQVKFDINKHSLLCGIYIVMISSLILLYNSGLTNPLVRWRRREGRLPPNHSMTQDGTLVIPRFFAEYSGEYICSATSQSQNYEASVFIIVTGTVT